MHESILYGEDKCLRICDITESAGADCFNGEAILDAGIFLLQEKGVNASVKELARISRMFDNHQMALALLGNYLREVHGGDPARLDTIPIWLDFHEEGRHVRRMLAAYCRWLHDTPEIAMMYLLSLTSRAVSIREARGLINKVLSGHRQGWFKRTPLPEIFLPLRRLSLAKCETLCDRLQALDLLSCFDRNGMLDMAPVAREYFFRQVQVCSPDTLLAVQGMPGVETMVSHSMNNDMRAIAGMEQQLEADLARKNWLSATATASRLSRQQRMLGNIPAAIQYARQSSAYAVLCADQSVLRHSLKFLLSLLQAAGDQPAADLIRQKLEALDEYVQAEVVS